MIVFCEDDVGLPQQRAENSRLREIAQSGHKLVLQSPHSYTPTFICYSLEQ